MNLFTIVAFEKSEDGYFNGLIQELSRDAPLQICCWQAVGVDRFLIVRGFGKVNVSFGTYGQFSFYFGWLYLNLKEY